MPAVGGGAELTVLHVLPSDLARGAQIYARTLRQVLDGRIGRHRTLTLFSSQTVALAPDHRLDVPDGLLRRVGLDPRVVGRLWRTLRRLHPDVVVAHGGEPLKYLACVPLRSRLVYYKIGTAEAQLVGPLRRWAHGSLARRADVVAAVSRDMLDEAAALLGVPHDRLALVPNGRDPSLYAPGAERATKARPGLVFVGHLDADKRPEWFVALVAELRERGLAFEAAIAGNGPRAEGLAEPARQAAVALLGRRNDVPEILAGSDILVSTSRREGLPGVLIEAGLAGVPVVTTEVSGAREVVEEGVTGFVVGRDDFDGLVEATQTLVLNEALRAQMGEQARRRCVERFSIEASAARWAELLTACVRAG